MKKKRKDDLEQWARRATRGIGDSATFLSLWNDKMASDPLDDPIPVVQLGLAMLLDKPIIIVAPHGAVIPINIQRAARSVKFYNPADLPSLEHATRAALLEAGVVAKH